MIKFISKFFSSTPSEIIKQAKSELGKARDEIQKKLTSNPRCSAAFGWKTQVTWFNSVLACNNSQEIEAVIKALQEQYPASKRGRALDIFNEFDGMGYLSYERSPLVLALQKAYKIVEEKPGAAELTEFRKDRVANVLTPKLKLS